ncbi:MULTISPECIES: hypothetical protein [Streptomyces]|uniref:Uncharacterized protein n=1 Tax=Streptomyces xanthii TaxID=2768069 RepID=A0A7H1BFJ3_9ACTN|nr:hypothetical protein [Streptomyces xanthii]QNS07498.1 hypothetical protein IAG42_30445 [Streptomyces xanthii]
MPPVISRPSRSADEVNEQIRSLWLRAGGRLTAEQRAQYALLVTEWAEATRSEVPEAA